MITLEPMDEATFEAWREVTVREYAEEKVASGNWLAADAPERSEHAFRHLLPDGRATAGHEIRSMVSEAGERVGYAWFVPEDRPFGRVVFGGNTGARQFYQRAGFVETDVTMLKRVDV